MYAIHQALLFGARAYRQVAHSSLLCAETGKAGRIVGYVPNQKRKGPIPTTELVPENEPTSLGANHNEGTAWPPDVSINQSFGEVITVNR